MTRPVVDSHADDLRLKFEQVQSKGHGLIEEVQVETSAERLHPKHGLLVLVKRKDCDGFLRVGIFV